MWRVNMTGKMKGWLVNSPISPDIVHWLAIISSPASHLCHWLKKKRESPKQRKKSFQQRLIILFSKNIFGFFCNYLNCIYHCNDHIVMWNYLLSWKKIDSWFSRDVTKIQPKKLPIFMSYYCTQTFIYTNFQSKRVLCVAIEDTWISRLLFDSAFGLWLGKLLCGLKMLPIFRNFGIKTE